MFPEYQTREAGKLEEGKGRLMRVRSSFERDIEQVFLPRESGEIQNFPTVALDEILFYFIVLAAYNSKKEHTSELAFPLYYNLCTFKKVHLKI